MYVNKNTGESVKWAHLNTVVYKDLSIPADGTPDIGEYSFVAKDVVKLDPAVKTEFSQDNVVLMYAVRIKLMECDKYSKVISATRSDESLFNAFKEAPILRKDGVLYKLIQSELAYTDNQMLTFMRDCVAIGKEY